MQNVLIYDDRLASAEYTPTHPFKPVRAKLFIELLHRYFNIYDDRFVMRDPSLSTRSSSIFFTTGST